MDYAIIAAGEGSRLVQEGVKTPKPLVRLCDTPLIERLVRVFLENGASSVSVIVNEHMPEVQAFVKKLRIPVPLHLHVQSTPSSMHSFHALSRYLKGECFCLTTVDTIFREEEFKPYVRAFETDHTLDGLMAVTDFIDDEKPLYVKTDDRLMIRGFADHAEADCRYVSGGIYCLRRSGLRVLDEAMAEGVSRMRNYQRKLVESGLRLRAYPFGKIIDVDHAGDVVKAEQFLRLKAPDEGMQGTRP
ncbi:MAG: NTP transferase domain-containing protein [Tannerella sp.]|jgi:NDP-sugar pyrophosphorylase family protein|nr:NTP transferase domain-containing protein [Tannerella sp.]